MRIFHPVSLIGNPDKLVRLVSIGIQPIVPYHPVLAFEIEEADQRWPEVLTLLQEWGVLTLPRTEFALLELDAAPFLKLGAWHHSYPMPSADFRYAKITYDPESGCNGNPSGTGLQRVGLCNMGRVQIAPFRFKGEPKWGKKHLLQLNWVFDEFFVRPEIWQKVFKPLGIGFEWVQHHKTGKNLETVVQLKIDQIAPSELLIPTGHPTETCSVCGRTRYHPWNRGFFPSFRVPPTTGHIWKTQEIFGSGGSAWNAVIISSTLYNEIQKHKLAGVSFMPMDGIAGSHGPDWEHHQQIDK